MNIVLFTTSFPYGGASANFLRNFTFALKTEGHNVEVLLPTGAYYGKKIDQQDIREGIINGVKYKRLGFVHHPKNWVGKIIDNLLSLILPFFYLVIRNLSKKLDIIILYNPQFLSLFFHLISNFFIRKKIILILPEFYEKPDAKIYSLSLIRWYDFYFCMKYLARYADKFIVLSTYLENYLLTRLKHKKEILIVPNLTDPEPYNIKNNKVFMPGSITIGYVGTPTRKDGILNLIQSFGILNKKYPKTHLLIIGDLTNGKSIIPKLKEYTCKLGIDEKNITFTGLISYKEIPYLLLSCQILALTRPTGVFAEAGFPTKLGEYFSCKKPVVLTRVGDMKTYFIDKEHVVFAEPENITSIVNAFEYLLNNKDKADEIGLNGYNWMIKNLYYPNQAAKISNFVSGNVVP